MSFISRLFFFPWTSSSRGNSIYQVCRVGWSGQWENYSATFWKLDFRGAFLAIANGKCTLSAESQRSFIFQVVTGIKHDIEELCMAALGLSMPSSGC